MLFAASDPEWAKLSPVWLILQAIRHIQQKVRRRRVDQLYGNFLSWSYDNIDNIALFERDNLTRIIFFENFIRVLCLFACFCWFSEVLEWHPVLIFRCTFFSLLWIADYSNSEIIFEIPLSLVDILVNLPLIGCLRVTVYRQHKINIFYGTPGQCQCNVFNLLQAELGIDKVFLVPITYIMIVGFLTSIVDTVVR
jgi:hypothetical protein